MVSATAQIKTELAADLTRVKSALCKLVRAADKARAVLADEEERRGPEDRRYALPCGPALAKLCDALDAAEAILHPPGSSR